MAVRLLFIFMFLSFWGIAVNPLTKKLSVDFKNIKIESALDEIQALGRFYFSYNSKVINVNKLITYSSFNENIEVILNHILGKGFDYKHRGKYIIIQKSDPTRYKKKKIMIKGSISSAKDSTQISDVTIYEIDELKTVSTDKNGDFNLTVSSEKKEVLVLISKENYKDTILTSSDFSDSNFTIYLEPDTTTPKWKKFLKMDSIPWLRIFYTDNILNTIRNVELSENRKFQFSLIPFVGTNGKLSGKITNNFSLNLISGYAYGVNGVEVGGVLNLIKDTMNGAQISGFGNIVGGKVSGAQIAGAVNYCHNSIKGVQISGAINIAVKSVSGAQIAGAVNYCHDSINGLQIAGSTNITAKTVSGLQIGGACNIASGLNGGGQIGGSLNYSQQVNNGFQIAGALNYNQQMNNGFQIAGALNYNQQMNNGFQIAGAININRNEMKGSQIAGLLNFTKNLSGFQISPFNFCDSVKSGAPIGLFSYVKSGFHKFELSYSDYLSGGISFRTGIHKFYNILSLDYYHHDTEPLASFGYGIGTQINFNRKVFSNFELNAKQIVSIDNFSSSFDQLNVLGKLNMNFGYNLGKHLSILGGPELNIFISDNSSTISNYENFTKRRTFYSNKSQSTFVDMRIGYRVALRF